MKYYQLDELNKFRRTNHKSKIAIIAISIFFVVFNTLLIIFSKYETKLLFKILLSVGNSLIICGLIFVITYFFIPSSKLAHHFETVMSKSSTLVEGIVKEISEKPISLSMFIKVYQVRVKTEENERLLYLLENFEIEQEILDSNIKFEVSDNFIRSYEKL